MRVKEFLDLPFDYFSEDKAKWLYVISSSLFVMLFIFIYEPFGVFDFDRVDGFAFFLVLLEGVKIFITLLATQLFLRKRVLKNKVWSLKNHLLYFMGEVLLLQIFTLLIYKCIEVFYDFSPFDYQRSFIEYAWIFFDVYISKTLVMIYPFGGTILYIYVSRLKVAKKELEEELLAMQDDYDRWGGHDNMIEVLDENGNVNLLLPLEHIISLESQNQYVLVNYIGSEGLEKKLVRTQLKKILSELEEYPVLQCHRSYAVNLLNTASLKVMEKKNYLLIKNYETMRVPVSKTYLAQIREMLMMSVVKSQVN
ncbi:LytTR family transcriptional regulator DNA-binding domain-containing protein [Aureibacter tunicatorum]|uniref:HTH LytTR-type domain-containing protein n=1 Tax=Aureibacter tunicatorum TaxID=866807 RepID=A0AAE3XJD1_9BACT|nr:LytTR family transcriptional regulator DNA-binding domain-containing protein [Aureibacter tunicatorum]MDR6238821.1 hypothetical protein [Aureibacter tunicatorum]BDD05252.1 hypothetical protein AUTU_27350 [Aureibacter tunicatorum]